MHDLSPFLDKTIDFSHSIKALSFGAPYPGMTNPLDGAKVAGKTPTTQPAAAEGAAGLSGMVMASNSNPQPAHNGMFQYFLKVGAGVGGNGQAGSSPGGNGVMVRVGSCAVWGRGQCRHARRCKPK